MLTRPELIASAQCHDVAARYAARNRITRADARAEISADLGLVQPERRRLVLSDAAAPFVQSGVEPPREHRWRLDAADLLLAAGADRDLAITIWRDQRAARNRQRVS